MEDVDDEVVTLSKLCSLLQQKVQKLDDAQEHGCHHAAETFQHVCNLLSTTSALNEKIKELEGASRASVLSELERHHKEVRVDQRRFEETVKKLLSNFKNEVTAVSRESESRHGILQKQLDQVQERLTDVVAAQRQFREDHTRLTAATDSLDRKLTDLRQETTEGIESLLQQGGEATTQKIDNVAKTLLQRIEGERKSRHELASAVQELNIELERIGREVSQCDNSLNQSQTIATDSRREVTQSIARIDSLMATHHAQLQQSTDRITDVEKRTAVNETSVLRLTTSTEALAASKASLEHTNSSAQRDVASLQEALKKLEADCDKRHRKLVESTRNALADVAKNTDGTPSVIAALQTELSTVRETLHAHHVAIEAQRLDGTLDSAFSEVKDWLQDLERRSMSRTEIEESLLTIQTQLTALRHAAHTADVVSGMNQRLEVERSTAHEFSQLSGRPHSRR